MLRVSRIPMTSATSSIRAKKIAMPVNTSRKIRDFSPRLLNNVLYKIDGRVSTSIKPSRVFPVCQLTAPNRVANGNCTSKALAAGGTRPASTRPPSRDRLTLAGDSPPALVVKVRALESEAERLDTLGGEEG